MMIHQLVSIVCILECAIAYKLKWLAVDFSNRFCCDRHSDGFDLSDNFPGKFHIAETLVFVDQAVNAATLRPKYHPVKEHEPLKAMLYAWQSCEHWNNPLRGVRQILWILTNSDIEVISKTSRTNLTNIDQIKTLLGASSDWVGEWGQKIVNEIYLFNAKWVLYCSVLCNYALLNNSTVNCICDILSFSAISAISPTLPAFIQASFLLKVSRLDDKSFLSPMSIKFITSFCLLFPLCLGWYLPRISSQTLLTTFHTRADVSGVVCVFPSYDAPRVFETCFLTFCS